jgi:hemerythrin superfamily protein
MKRKNTPDAVDLLDADHLSIHAMFEQYRTLVRSKAPALSRRTLAEDLCMELTIHAKLEEELFYPAVRDALQDEDLVDESEDQHGSMRELVGQILAGRPEDELYDAKVAVLAEYVERHVRQEREQVFNRVLASGLDLHSLARTLVRRKEELRSVSDALREDALAQAAV